MLMAVACFALGELGMYLSFAGVKIFILVSFFIILIHYYKESKNLRNAVFVFAMFILGAIRLFTYDGDDIFKVLHRDSISGASVSATVSDISRTKSGYQIFLDDVEILCEDTCVSVKRKLVVRLDANSFRLGQRVSAVGSLTPFSKGNNPGEFNEFNYYRARNAECRLTADEIHVINPEYYKYRDCLRCLRDELVLRLRAVLDAEDAGLLEAVILGDKADMDSDIKKMYQRAGIAHVIAISGVKTESQQSTLAYKPP